MKRLTILTVIAMVTVATSSGCRTCGWPFSIFNRGDSCNTWDAGSADSYAASYGSGMIYEGDTMLPPVTGELLPGPRAATQ
ncbi:MAG: hypothetical protein O3C40_20475 [Planctomycetota bacterium]|nr:hypothetical protein [Planctomycetota bacterium]